MPILLCTRILDIILICSSTSIFCKHYYHILIQHIVSLNLNNSTNLPIYYAAIKIWANCPLEILLIEANSFNEFSLKLLNVWHIPTQLISINCQKILINRCGSKIEYLVPKIVVELYRVILFYERNEAFDVALSSREHIDYFIADVKLLFIRIKELNEKFVEKLMTEMDELNNVILGVK